MQSLPLRVGVFPPEGDKPSGTKETSFFNESSGLSLIYTQTDTKVGPSAVNAVQQDKRAASALTNVLLHGPCTLSTGHWAHPENKPSSALSCGLISMPFTGRPATDANRLVVM